MQKPGGYKQFCPVAMAAEVICSRWTLLVVRELLAGSTRFNDLRRGVPRMSPALLSQRLKELEREGVIDRVPGPGGSHEYRLTQVGRELEPIVEAIGLWGQRWIDAEVSLKNLDPSLLMWDMRRNLDPRPLPERRCTIHFLYPELPDSRGKWWLVVDREGVDLCSFDPGFEVDLYVETDLRTMTAIWMGLTEVRRATAEGALTLTGDDRVGRSMQEWLGLSPFAREKKLRAA